MKTENEFAYILEQFLDDYIANLVDNGSTRKPNFENTIQVYKPTKRDTKALKEHFDEVLSEIQSALSEPESDFAEGWDFLSKTKLKKLEGYLTDLIDVLESKSKIVRKKKKTDPSKLIKGIQFEEKSDEFDLESIDPIDIIGAKGLLCFNTKTSKITLFESEEEDGLSVKGTTIQNFSESSVCKTLRKNNQDMLNTFGDGVLSRAKNLMDSIKTKGYPPSGRINKDTIIVRAYLN